MVFRKLTCIGALILAAISNSALAQAPKLPVGEKAYACSINKGEKAIELCTIALRDDKPWGYLRAALLVHRAMAYRDTGKPDLAQQDFQDATDFKPDGTNGYMIRATAFSELKAYTQAISDYDKAIGIDTLNEDAFLNRGITYLNLRQYDRATADFTAALKLKPNRAETFLFRGHAYRMTNNAALAAADYGQALKFKADLKQVNEGLCWSRAMAGQDLEAALTNCNDAVRAEPDKVDTMGAHALIAFRAGNYAASIAECSSILEKYGNTALCLYVRGLAKIKTGDASGGNADITGAGSMEATLPDVLRKYGVGP